MKKKALLVGVNTSEDKKRFQYLMEELGNLAAACHIETVGVVTQNLPRPHKAYYVGTGKLEELKNFAEETDCDLVIFDDELSGSQIKNLEEALDRKVYDRTMLILDIFAERAKTKESQLQVEVARLKYELPRLVGSNEDLGRQGGGAGLKNRGAGETKLELDRRVIEERIAALNKELEKIVEQRQIQRRKRKKNLLPVVSLVGYTNAGKSTIMNAMVERYQETKTKQVFEMDMLFATLETSVRKIKLESNQTFLLTDTVGFIKKLPHHLVKAFRSTLEEVLEADLIIHVLDASNPDVLGQKEVTDRLLTEMGVKDVPILYAYNKADLTDQPYPQVERNEIYLSAKNRIGIEELAELIKKELFSNFVKCELRIPFSDGAVVSYFNENSHVLHTEYTEEGTTLLVECHPRDVERFRTYVASS